MVIESTVTLRNRLKSILSNHGYSVSSFNVSQEALDDIRASKSNSYAVIISSYMMPNMKGDILLSNAREVSPESQRLLIADTEDLETMVSAINTAGIDACLTLPIQDEDFLAQVAHCCDSFEAILKQKNLKRITTRQNHQLFKIARNFKKKTDHYSSQVSIKDKEIRVLESRIRATGGTLDIDKPVEIKDILSKRNIVISKENLCAEFNVMKHQIQQIFEIASSQHHIKIKTIDYEKAATLSQIEHEYKHSAKNTFWQPICTLLEKSIIPGDKRPLTKIKDIILDEYFDIAFSEEKTNALIKVKTSANENLNVAHVMQFLEKHKIINGIKNQHEIETWLQNAYPEEKPYVIAKGKAPVNPQDAQIRYHFEIDFLQAGKINEDGSINFQDRGEIPYVEEDELLAAKIFSKKGAPGIDVMGELIPVDEPEDITFSTGPGTRLSEDEIKIYATVAGQPNLDAMGNISVCQEYQLKGDIGFETGDVDFEGNVIVNGSVKHGFKVKCASLTANEIQGAEIDISGDLNVSMGIIDTELIKVKGNVQAKFIHNSKINAFGDLIVQKEIIDSKIYLSGACINKNGSIINSEISAKMGIEGGSIGNETSKPSILRVGVDENTRLLVAKIDSELHINSTAISDLNDEIQACKIEDQEIHATISQNAYIQDRAQLELKDIEKKMEDLKASGNMAAFQKVSKTVQEIKENAQKAEEKINQGFDRQDTIEMDISQKKFRTNELLEMNAIFEDEKKRLREFSNRKKALSEVKVLKNVTSGTKIFSKNASLRLYKSENKCRIKEFSHSPDGVDGDRFYDLQIINH